MTFSGGEPFCQPEPLTELAKLVHGAGKDVVVFTGWTYEQLLEKDDPAVNALLAETDLLIDGPFVLEQRNLELRFRGCLLYTSKPCSPCCGSLPAESAWPGWSCRKQRGRRR